MSIMKATTLKKGREGFTLIELLLVIVIIGILAAIAMPKFNRTRERAHFKALMSDLRNLQAQQELYYARPANQFQYAAVVSDLQPMFTSSPGSNIVITAAGSSGWAASATHSAMISTNVCAVFQGDPATIPAPALTAGVVTCTGE
jgi:type IV pilus assembly protein PilA